MIYKDYYCRDCSKYFNEDEVAGDAVAFALEGDDDVPCPDCGRQLDVFADDDDEHPTIDEFASALRYLMAAEGGEPGDSPQQISAWKTARCLMACVEEVG